MKKQINKQPETHGITKNQYINQDTTEEHNTELLRRKAGILIQSRAEFPRIAGKGTSLSKLDDDPNFLFWR